MYAHIYADQIVIDYKINESRTQTIIEFRLYKQQTEIKWPQLCSRQTASVVPKESNANIATTSPQINSAIEHEAPKEISLKKIHSTFIETNDDRVISRLDIKQAFNCQAEFTDTNFTVIFQTKFVLLVFLKSIL